MPDFPVVIGWGLGPRDRLLLDYWTDSANGRVQLHETTPSGPLENSGVLHFFPSAGIPQIRELLGWFVPVLLLCAADAEIPESFFEMGLAAICRMPADDSMVILPPAPLPQTDSVCFVVSDSALFRTRLRQVLRFSGRLGRMDFSSTDDIAQVLAAVVPWPELIIVDLDSERVDSLSLFYRLEKILRERPEMRAKNQLMICKDFSRPGLDLVKLRPVLSPHARRIFHPSEALLALLETLIFFPSTPVSVGLPARSLRQMLYGDDNGPPGRSLKAQLSEITAQHRALTRGIAFFEFAGYLEREGASGLAIRTDAL